MTSISNLTFSSITDRLSYLPIFQFFKGKDYCSFNDKHVDKTCRCARCQKLPHIAIRASLTVRFLLSDLLMMDCFMNFVDPEERLPSQSQKTLYYCPKCLHGFTLKSNRNRHFRYECGHEPRFKCPYCELRSKQTSQIYSHIRKKHPSERVWVVDLKS